ncbi:MAG: response regulator [Lachnospiraceae bacterium]|jgi:signal transduction histidine kinase/ActR/RegA family two-component response regulator|nr:response regulator [Lachnospiraceae bacterium]
MKVTSKLIIGFAITLAITIAVGGLGISGMRYLEASGNMLYEQRIRGLEDIHGIVSAYRQMTVTNREVLINSLYNDKQGAMESRSQFEDSYLIFGELMNKSRANADDEVLVTYHEQINLIIDEELLPLARVLMDVVIDDIPDHQNRLMIQTYTVTLIDISVQVENLLSGLVAYNAALAAKVNLDNARMTHLLITIQIILIFVTLIAISLIAFLIIRGISIPIKESMIVLQGIAAGDFSVRVKGKYRGDFGKMKDSVNDSAVRLSEYMTGMLEAERAAHEIELDKARVESEAKAQLEEEARKTDAALMASKAKSDFLALMSHEIRTPMNVILGVTDIYLSDDTLSDDHQKAFNMIYSSGDLLLGIINDLLDMSKIEAGKLETLPQNYDVVAMISEVAASNQIRFSQKQDKIRFELSVDENIPATLHGDDLRIKQIINNLLSNAFKYTKEGKIEFVITQKDIPNTINSPATGDETNDFSQPMVEITYTISDTGIGMTKEQTASLFDEYTRFDMKANRTTEGTGLGMNITQKLIKLMAGTITVDSTKGVGTTVTVRLPQGRPGDEVVGKTTAREMEKDCRGIVIRKRTRIIHDPMPYGKVLIVDDIEMNIFVVSGLLSVYQINVDTAASGSEAIELIANGNIYDIILMDYMMPDMDGIEAVRHIRDLGYDGTIVALTADAVSGRVDIFLAGGFDDYLIKPININKLDAILHQYIKDKQTPEVIAKASLSLPIVGEKTDGKLFDRIEIEGLDSEKGLARFGGNQNSYLKVLRKFVAGTRAVLPILAEVTEDKLSAYLVSVHGVKGTCREIFADSVGDIAKELELAAEKGDYPYIAANNAALITAVSELIDTIEKAISEIENRHPRPQKERVDEVTLKRLRDACGIYAMREIDTLMDEIEAFSYTEDDGLAVWLRDVIDAMDFEQVVAKITEVLGEKD